MTLWRIGFVARAADSPWWFRLLHPAYAHCWAARRLWRDTWMWLEWSPRRLIVGLADTGTVRLASRAAIEVLIYPAAEEAPRPRLPILALHSCAAIVAHTVGLNLPLATPWRLARALRARGARSLMPPR